MPIITFVAHDGTSRTVETDVGYSAMNAAVNNGIDGILGDCGGSCSCCTCHVFVPDEWRDAVGPAGAGEEDLLSIRDDVAENSRLACQITLTPALDGLVLHMPAEQY
jgi:2Fe-2S ferredoxin